MFDPTITDDREIIGTPPTDGCGVEIAPGVFVPENRCDETMELVASDADLYEMLHEIILERESQDDLTNDAPIEFPYWFVARVQREMARQLHPGAQSSLCRRYPSELRQPLTASLLRFERGSFHD